MTIVTFVLADQKFVGQRLRPKFRPKQEWFSEMLPKTDPYVYDEQMQSDQPANQYNSNNSPFQDFYLDDYEMPENRESASADGGKFPRQQPYEPTKVFQNLCPIVNYTISLESDKMYEYVPNRYMVIKCEYN